MTSGKLIGLKSNLLAWLRINTMDVIWSIIVQLWTVLPISLQLLTIELRGNLDV